MRDLYKSDILRLAKPVTSLIEHSVYFLINNNDIVYVGYSSKVYSRINKHFYDKEFTDYHVLKYDTMEEALQVETHYIKTLKPIYNIKDNPEKLDENSLQYRLKKPYRAEKIPPEEKPIKENVYIKDTLIISEIKINIPIGTYILKKDGNLYFNIKGQIYTPTIKNNCYYFNNIKYKHPTNIFGNISNLIER